MARFWAMSIFRCYNLGYSFFSSLGPLICHFGPQIRILHVEILPRDTSWGLETLILENLIFQLVISVFPLFPPFVAVVLAPGLYKNGRVLGFISSSFGPDGGTLRYVQKTGTWNVKKKTF